MMRRKATGPAFAKERGGVRGRNAPAEEAARPTVAPIRFNKRSLGAGVQSERRKNREKKKILRAERSLHDVQKKSLRIVPAESFTYRKLGGRKKKEGKEDDKKHFNERGTLPG